MNCNLVHQLMMERPFDWLEHLQSSYSIQAVRDGSLVSLKYNQIESPMRHPIVQQCRGMVVCTVRRRVLAWPYHKFWNHGETLADSIDWVTARVQEKLDGSLMIVYYDEGDWHVASSGHPTAGGSFGSESITFATAFWNMAADLGIDVTGLDPDVTYMFELCAAPNRIVVKHDKPRLVLHGGRNLTTGTELSRVALEASAARANCEVVREYPIASVDGCLHAAAVLDPLQQEGFVVVDDAFRRVKIKSPRYVTLHHLKGEMSVRRAIELWKTGEASELLAHFPEFAAEVQRVHDELERIADQAVLDYAEVRHCPSRKEFAAAVKDRPWSSVLFRMLTDGYTRDAVIRIMSRQTTASLERLVSNGDVR